MLFDWLFWLLPALLLTGESERRRIRGADGRVLFSDRVPTKGLEGLCGNAFGTDGGTVGTAAGMVPLAMLAAATWLRNTVRLSGRIKS